MDGGEDFVVDFEADRELTIGEFAFAPRIEDEDELPIVDDGLLVTKMGEVGIGAA